jgi:hypothetical protein
MNGTPATDKVKSCCTFLACGRVLLVNAAKWKDGLPCPLCKKGTLVKFTSTETPMVPVVRVRVVPDPKPVAPPRIDDVPVVPVRVIPDPKPVAKARTESVPVVPVRVIPDPQPTAAPRTEKVPVVPVRVIADPQLAALPHVDGVPVVAVRHIPETAPAAEWLPAKKTAAPPVAPPPATTGPVPTVILAENTPVPATAQPAAEVILVGELVEGEADVEAVPTGTYGIEGVRTPPRCPRCKANLQPNTERCPGCAFDFSGDWERRLLDQDKLQQEIKEEKRRQAEAEAAREEQEQRERANDAAWGAVYVSIWSS